MTDYSKRSLNVSVERLDDLDKSFLRKFTCEAQGCGSKFVFSISADANRQLREKGKQYSGTCGHCGKSVLLGPRQFEKWRRLVKGSELRLRETTYSKLFE